MPIAQLDQIIETRRVLVSGRDATPSSLVFGFLNVANGLAPARAVAACDGTFKLRFSIQGRPQLRSEGGACNYGHVIVNGQRILIR